MMNVEEALRLVDNAKVTGSPALSARPLDCWVMPLVKTGNGNDRLQEHV